MGHIIQDNLRKILNKNEGYENINIFVETGTFKGEQTEIASFVFGKVYGIELNDHWYNVTKERNRSYEYVEIIKGDTAIELPKLLEKYKDTPLFIYLDAHFCKTKPPIPKSEFPLWKELEVIKNRDVNDIIAVDDVHTFGVKRNRLKIDKNIREWEDVTTKTILNFLGNVVIDNEILNDSLIIWK